MRKVIIPFIFLIMIFQLNIPLASAADTAITSKDSADGKMHVAVTASCKDYNKVGNEWSWTVTVNGEPIETYQTLTVQAGDILYITATVEEHDKKYSDIGEEKTTFIVSENDIAKGFEVSLQVKVIENGGTYKNNAALWTVVCSFTN